VSQKDARLKLRATDAEDLQIISAMLQDALVAPGDMQFVADKKSFVLAANRFRWELAAAANGHGREQPDERVGCGVTFANVARVRRRGIDRKRRDGFLNLLAIELSEPADGRRDGVDVLILFAGDKALLVETSGLLCQMEDFGESYPTQWRPSHDEG